MNEPAQDAIAFLQEQHDQARSPLNGLSSGGSGSTGRATG